MRGDWLSQYGQEPTDPRFNLGMVAFFAGFPLGGETASLGSAFPPTSVDDESHRGGGFGIGLPKVGNVSLVLAIGNLGKCRFWHLGRIAGGLLLGVGKPGQQRQR